MSAVPQTKPRTGTDTVAVGCKIPQGFTLQLHEFREMEEVTLGGHRTVRQAFPVGEPFVLNGPAHPQNEGPRCLIVGGFAVTHGVPKDLWDKWMDQTGKYLPAVREGMIIAYSAVGKLRDAARERVGVTTGLERLNPNKLPVMNKKFELKTADDSPIKFTEIEVDGAAEIAAVE